MSVGSFMVSDTHAPPRGGYSVIRADGDPADPPAAPIEIFDRYTYTEAARLPPTRSGVFGKEPLSAWRPPLPPGYIGKLCAPFDGENEPRDPVRHSLWRLLQDRRGSALQAIGTGTCAAVLQKWAHTSFASPA